jgi:glucose/mannose-6-phosphate isomerase
MLDAPELYERIDRSGMRSKLPELAQQCRNTLAAVCDITLPANYTRSSDVVVVGMGTSGIAAAMAADLLHHAKISTALTVWRDFALPRWVRKQTLVVACSVSGNTQEVLSAFDAGVKAGARMVALTSGGILAERAARLGVPVVKVASSWGGRHSLGATYIGLLGVLSVAGKLPFAIIESASEAAMEVERLTSLYHTETPEERNPAKLLARRLYNRVPVVYSSGLLQAAGRRWAYDFNENAKSWAISDSLPELQHNAVMGYDAPPELHRDAHVIVLTCPLLPEELRRRTGLTLELLERAGVAHTIVGSDGSEVVLRGRGSLAHQLGTVYLGSWVSYYLAMLYGVDPVPNEALELVRQHSKVEPKVERPT